MAQPSGDAQGDGVGFADPVVANSVQGVGAFAGVGGGFRPVVMSRGGGGPVWQGSVGPAVGSVSEFEAPDVVHIERRVRRGRVHVGEFQRHPVDPTLVALALLEL